jgi:hypothetical protein
VVDGSVLVALSNGDAFKTWALAILGNIALVVIAGRSLGYLAKQEWGAFITFGFAAVVVAGFVWAPDQTKVTLMDTWNLVAKG